MIRVMIVDDEPFIRQGLQILINWEQYGFEICGEASNGMEAIELLKEKDFDLIVTDIKMPKLDGINLIGYVRENISKDIRFVILSGFYEYDYAKKAIRYDVEDYLLKPVQKDELIHLLEEYRERHEQMLEEQKQRELTKKLVLDNYAARLLTGLQIPEELEYIRKALMDDTEVDHLGLAYGAPNQEYKKLSAEDRLQLQLQMYEVMKGHMDALVQAVEENNEALIRKQTDAIYDYFRDRAADANFIRVNLDYLLYNLINLIKKLNPDYDVRDIYRMINPGGREQGLAHGSVEHIRAFSMEVATYLNRLRQSNLGGVLSEVEREIAENYAKNLNLKTLGETYFINSAYLGQLFKKKYGVAFKDYLNNVRIERAAELLLRSDKKIYLIAEEVGFNNTDYFISKFVQLKGVTPLQFRKQAIEK